MLPAPAASNSRLAEQAIDKPRQDKPGREDKLSATGRSFAILEHVARARTAVDVMDIIDALNLPKATAYRLVDWFVTQGFLSGSRDASASSSGRASPRWRSGRWSPRCATRRATSSCSVWSRQ